MSEERELIRELVEECLDRYEMDGEAAVEEICATHPKLADRIRSRLSKLRDAGLLATESTEIPERLGEFRLLRRLGTGGMGVVYLAVQEPLGREVALKIVRPDQLFFEGARERFQREVEAIARLEHPSIVPIYTVGEADGVPYFAMERVRGLTLAEVLQALAGREPADLNGTDLDELVGTSALTTGSWVQVCCRIAQRVASALEHAHARGVVHRDVKPSNIMLTEDGRVLLLDFGLARSEGTSALTRTGSQLGSLPYMAPEQVRGEIDRIGVRTDVYGLGVTLYEILTLCPPFGGTTAEALRGKILAGKAPPLQSWNRAVARDAETICLKAMDADSARRYESADAFAADLGRFLELRPIEARRPGPLMRLRRTVQRNPAWTAVVAVLVLGASAIYVQRTLGAADLRRAHARAEAALNSGIQTLDSLLRRADNEQIRGLPGADRLCRSLLADAQKLQASLRKLDGDKATLDLLDGRVLRHIAKLQRVVGQLADSERTISRAIATLRSLAATPGEFRELARIELRHAHHELSQNLQLQRRMPEALAAINHNIELQQQMKDGERFTHGLASSLATRGNLALLNGDLQLAEDSYRGSIASLERMLAAGYDQAGVRLSLARSHLGLGNLFRARGKPDDAVRCFENARGCLRTLLEADESNIEARKQLAMISFNLSGLHSSRNENAKALAAAKAAVDAFSALAAGREERPELIDRLAISRRHYAWLLHRTGETEAATAPLDRAERELAPLTERHPEVTLFRSHLATVLMTRGQIHQSLSQIALARRAFGKAAKLHESVLAKHPDVPGYLYDSAVTLLYSLTVTRGAVRRRNLDAAVAQFRKSNTLAPGNAQTRGSLGLALLLLASSKATIGEPEAAMQHLREAMREAGVTRTRIRATPGLQRLHDRDDYRELVGGG